jgi:hypothetical protein
MTENTFIMGNPPFNGSRLMTEDQKKDTLKLWSGISGAGNLDYVANWFLIASQWSHEKGVRVGLVATSSISQGEQPSIIWGKIQPLGVGIDFAYRSFWWDNGAAVHCVIVGFSATPKPKKRQLWEFSDIKGEPQPTWVDNINGYLLNAPNTLVSKRSKPIFSDSPRMDFGSMPNDGGFLSNITEEEAREIRDNDSVARKYLRQIVGGQEFINRQTRYCLWLADCEPADIRASHTLAERVAEVRRVRLESKREATRKLADRPSLFAEIRQPAKDYVAVPLISSENREYVPVGWLSKEIISNNKIGIVANPKPATFGFLSSLPFNAWNRIDIQFIF